MALHTLSVTRPLRAATCRCSTLKRDSWGSGVTSNPLCYRALTHVQIHTEPYTSTTHSDTQTQTLMPVAHMPHTHHHTTHSDTSHTPHTYHTPYRTHSDTTHSHMYHTHCTLRHTTRSPSQPHTTHPLNTHVPHIP